MAEIKLRYGYYNVWYGPDMDGSPRVFEEIVDKPEEGYENSLGWWFYYHGDGVLLGPVDQEGGFVGPFPTEEEAREVSKDSEKIEKFLVQFDNDR